MKIKTRFILMLLLVAGSFCLNAQQKYDYAHLTYAPNLGGKMNGIYISINGKETEKVPVDRKLINQFVVDYAPFIDYIKTMADKGWEIIGIPADHVVYMRKKSDN